jgi:hypothetical protein
VSPLVAPPWCRLVMPAAGCRIASCRPRIVPPSHCLVVPADVALPLAVLSLRCPLFVLLRQLVATLPLAVLSLRHPLVNLSRQLVVASPLLILLLCPVPPFPPLVMTAGCCVASQHVTLSLSRRLAVSLSRRASSRCLVAPAGCRAIISCRPLVAAPSLVLSSCWLVVVLPVLAPPFRPLIIVHRRGHRTPSNAAAAIEHHRHRRH